MVICPDGENDPKKKKNEWILNGQGQQQEEVEEDGDHPEDLSDFELHPLKTKLSLTKNNQVNNGPAKLEEVPRYEDFQDLLKAIGSQGPYQKFLLYAVMGPVVALGAFLAMNAIFILYIPPHHCYVEGQPELMSIEEWKNLTLPLEVGPDGRERFSQCLMYYDPYNLHYDENGKRVTIPCDQGWVYDKSDYDNTLPTDYNWVCDKKSYPTDVFSVSGAGNAVGQVIFGILADKVGRKPIFFVSLFILTFFKLIALFIPHAYTWFLVMTFLSGTGMPLMFASPSLISAEVCDNEYRAWVFSFTWMIWVAGMASMPLIAKLSRQWFLIGIITTVPGLILFVFNIPIIPESPRWLLSVGRLTEAKKIIIQIAKRNGNLDKLESIDLDETLKRIDQEQHKGLHGTGSGRKSSSDGFWTLFKKKRLARNTIMLTIAWSMNTLIYEGITLNTPNVGGIDQFLNFFILSVIEVPSSMLGGYLLDKVGRRWTQAAFFLLCSVSCFIGAVVVLYPDLTITLILMVIAAKFCVTLTFLVVFLQATELFPTHLRSTGYSVASTIGAVLSIFGPHIVFAGQFYVGAPYILMGLLGMFGMLAAVMLPETLNQNLPETLEDAVKFGKGHKFWSIFPTTATATMAAGRSMSVVAALSVPERKGSDKLDQNVDDDGDESETKRDPEK